MRKAMIKKTIGLSFLVLTALPLYMAQATCEKENQYLVQVLNQLDAMLPLITAAEREQPNDLRIRFHYTQYRDANGKLHNGLKDDIQTIRRGIEEKLNSTSNTARTLLPIEGDYVSYPNKKNEG
jgi:RAQPRD family integrative conjugative element protein